MLEDCIVRVEIDSLGTVCPSYSFSPFEMTQLRMKSLTIACSVLCLLVHSSEAFHKFFSGQCPQVEPMPDFKINRFLGQWFVIENYNDNVVSCLQENFTLAENQSDSKEMFDMARNELEHEKDTPLEKIYQVQRSYLSFGGRQMMHETGKIKFRLNSSLAEMDISFPYTETGMLNLKHYQVVATDYDRYALVWRCQRTIFGHRRTAQIMSRQRSIEPQTLKELQVTLKQLETDETIRLNSISQSNCDHPEETFSGPSKPSLSKPHKPDRMPAPTADWEKPEQNKQVNTGDKGNGKNKKKLISIDVGGFHLSISLPFW